MSQVLRVSLTTGEYEFLDTEGKVTGQEMSMIHMDTKDADVLMERIRQGYVNVVPGAYVIRQELTGFGEDDFFEFTEMVTFNLDEDGYPVPITHHLLTDQQWARASEYDSPGTRLAVVDYEAKTIGWLNNPLADEWQCADPLHVPVVPYTTDIPNTILGLAKQHLLRGMPVHVTAIPVRFN